MWGMLHSKSMIKLWVRLQLLHCIGHMDLRVMLISSKPLCAKKRRITNRTLLSQSQHREHQLGPLIISSYKNIFVFIISLLLLQSHISVKEVFYSLTYWFPNWPQNIGQRWTVKHNGFRGGKKKNKKIRLSSLRFWDCPSPSFRFNVHMYMSVCI